MTDKQVIIHTFPHRKGDTREETMLSLLTPEKVFTKPYRVSVNGRIIDDWDELLDICEEVPEPVEIIRFMPVAGG